MSSAGGGGGAGAAVRTGHLRKLKTMKKKYFVLRAETPECSARLEYYESEKKYKSGVAPRRVIPLKSCYNITRRLDLKQKHVIALFTKEEQFCVVAENEQDLHGWLSAILKQHRNDDASEELKHPIQHVWQVNVQKKGLGATKNIQGLYNLCLTDKTLALVKIKSQNNVISDLEIPERIEYSLKNIRRCGDSECFFYMEVGRQTTTGAGELWMHSDDSNIAQSMHSTIYHAMRNCAKETENERDHIVIPKRADSVEGSTVPARRQTLPGNAGRTSLANAENQPPNNSLTEHKENPPRIIKHHRTISLPTGCPLFQEPLRIVHERTRSAPLTGDEVDRVVLEKTATHSSCKAVNGTDLFVKKTQWSRRASTGTRLSKLSPAHSKNAGKIRSRCDSMPSTPCSSFEVERPTPRHTDSDGLDVSRDDTDSVEWHRTPRIPEEPDFCDSAIKDLLSSSLVSHGHSRTSSLGLEEAGVPDGYVPMAGHAAPPAHPAHPAHPATDVTHPPHAPPPPVLTASSGSVCSGTPSTDPRFSEYQLEPAMSHIVDCERPPRAYSVGSRPVSRPDPPRHRAYSVGARSRPAARPGAGGPHGVSSAPQLPRASAEDLMELDFSNNSPQTKMLSVGTPPASVWAGVGVGVGAGRAPDEYVDMSPRNAGYVEMRPGERAPAASQRTAHTTALTTALTTANTTAASTPDGYVEMNYGRGGTRPIAIGAVRAPPPAPARSCSPEGGGGGGVVGAARGREGPRTPLGEQTIFPLSIDSPASPPDPAGPPPLPIDEQDIFYVEPEVLSHPLSTVRELSEDGRADPPGGPGGPGGGSPSYVQLAYHSPSPAPLAATHPAPLAPLAPLAPPATHKTDAPDRAEVRGGSTTVVVSSGALPTPRFAVPEETGGAPTAPPAPPGPVAPPLNYAALDLQPRAGVAAPPHRTYTQIDFARSEKLAADNN